MTRPASRMPQPPATPAIRRTAAACIAFAFTMVGLAYASVPLYNMFCRVTGYDGTPLVGDAPATAVLDRTVSIRFDTNVAAGLPWIFTPETAEIQARIGETQTVFFRVRNEGRAPATGIATFNVQPGPAGGVFVKLKCFCFDEQTLRPGETMDFPVVFYIDPSIKDDPTLDGLSAITLSYTYFASRNGRPLASVDTGARPKL